MDETVWRKVHPDAHPLALRHVSTDDDNPTDALQANSDPRPVERQRERSGERER